MGTTSIAHLTTNKITHKINALPTKAISYDDISAHGMHAKPSMIKRANFPYAFIRSRLSVLPEENGGSVINKKRIQENKISNKPNNNNNNVIEPNRKYILSTIKNYTQIKRIRLMRKISSNFIGIIFTQYFCNGNNNSTYRYIISDIRSNGLAFDDGRLRIGDEIINVNGQDLRNMQSCKSVEQLIETFIDNCVELVIVNDDELSTKTIDNECSQKLADDIKYLLQERKKCDLSQTKCNKFEQLLDCTDYVPVYRNQYKQLNVNSARSVYLNEYNLDADELEKYKLHKSKENISCENQNQSVSGLSIKSISHKNTVHRKYI